MNKPKLSKSGVPTIPMNEPIAWVAREIIRRPASSSDRRLRRLFNGERGLPFKPTADL
jgi:hypothetical protein